MYSYRYKCYIHSTIFSSQSIYEIITRPPTIWTSLNGSYPGQHIVGEVISSSEGTAIQFVWKYNLLQAWIPSSVLIDEKKLVLNPCNLFKKNYRCWQKLFYFKEIVLLIVYWLTIILCTHLALFSSRKNRTNVNNLFSVTYKFPEAKLNHARNISGDRG